MHPYFHLFGLNIPAYGTLAGIGFLVAGVYAVLLSRGDRRVSRADLGYAAVIGGCGMLIGAKLLALITEIPFIIEYHEQIFSSVESFSLFFLSGWVFYGGLIGGLAGAWIFCRRWKVDFGAVCDIAAPAIPLFHTFGRVGCFLSGCCHGVRWEHGIAFTEAIAAPNGVPLFPVQLVEAGCNLLLCVVLTLLRKRFRRSGTLLCVYLVCYAAARFVLEFLRGDAIRGVLILSTSQWISAALFVGAVIWIVKNFRQGRSNSMTYVTEGREPSKALRFFEELCAIPRPSGGEAKVADWLCEFAKARGLEHHRDELGDVIIKRPGVGAPLMLQGHTDMVSAVAPEKGVSDAIAYLAEHGVTPILDGDLLHADGTTLGADNGVAVAMMLAILDSPELRTPPLECVFTVQEETGLFGAKAVDGSLISARRMINLDSEKDGMLTVSCAGGCRIAIEREFSASEGGECALRLDVSGLLGGHSGEQIHLPRENAIHLCARLAGLLRIGGRLAWIRGGEADNAIPRSCSALIVYSSAERMDNAKSRFAELKFDYPHEPELKVSLTEANPEPALADGEDLFEMLAALPNGVQARDEKNGFVLTSLNCGVISTDGGKVRTTLSLRSSVAENMVALKNAVIGAAEKFGFDAIVGAEYPGWAFREVSPLRDTLCAAWKKVTGEEMQIHAIHAGLECGLFSAKLPDLDAAALGPTINDCHTPQESLDLTSLERTWDTLVAALEMLAE